MTEWKDSITPTIDRLGDDRIRIVLEVNEKEIGVLYFERAKKGWTNKPLTNGWTCVDAKVEGFFLYVGDNAVPKDLVEWCQNIISREGY